MLMMLIITKKHKMTLFLRLTTLTLLLGCVSSLVLATDNVVEPGDDALVKSKRLSSESTLASQEKNPDLSLASTQAKVARTPSSMPVSADAIPVEEKKNEEAAKQDDSVITVQPDTGKTKKTKGCGGGCTLF